MPPFLTLFVEIGLIWVVTYRQWRELGRMHEIYRAEQGRQIKFEPLRAFIFFWLRCLVTAGGLWLLTTLVSWSRLGGLDAAWSGLGVIMTVAFLLGLGLGIWLFAAWWQPALQSWQHDFKRPTPPRRRYRQVVQTDFEAMEPDTTVMDLPPYHELKPPASNSQVKWCEECSRWIGTQHKHGAVAV